MKPRWLQVLLALSLLGNAVELVLYARRVSRERRRWESASSAEQRTLRFSTRPLGSAYPDEQRVLKRDYVLTRAALSRLLNDQPADSGQLAATMDRLDSLNRATYLLLFRSARDMHHVQSPGTRRSLERRWRLMMGLPLTPGDGR